MTRTARIRRSTLPNHAVHTDNPDLSLEPLDRILTSAPATAEDEAGAAAVRQLHRTALRLLQAIEAGEVGRARALSEVVVADAAEHLHSRGLQLARRIRSCLESADAQGAVVFASRLVTSTQSSRSARCYAALRRYDQVVTSVERLANACNNLELERGRALADVVAADAAELGLHAASNRAAAVRRRLDSGNLVGANLAIGELRHATRAAFAAVQERCGQLSSAEPTPIQRAG